MATDQFVHGRCHELAVALHELTGKPIHAGLVEVPGIGICLVHAWVAIDAETCIDARGLMGADDVLAAFPEGDEAVKCQIDALDVMELGTGRRSLMTDAEMAEAFLTARQVLDEAGVSFQKAIPAGNL